MNDSEHPHHQHPHHQHPLPEDPHWSPAAGLVGVGWVLTAAAAAWCVLLFSSGADPAGRLIAGVAAVGLLVGSLFGTLARPRLAADAAGVTVRGLLGTRRFPWSRVRGVRVVRVRRLGREGSLLELDVSDGGGTERLIVFGRLDLDADPEDVADILAARRPV
ncbi:MAG: PH domain-containing protein [Pseudonocardia sp.]|nr:PH domain-containing protein [Pseudonocardia sp.]